MSALKARDLSLAFGEHVVVTNLDIDVAAGEIHAIVGLNGAGKTTIMRLLLGMLHPDGGEVRVAGKPLASFEPREWSAIGYLIESPFAYPELTVRENLTMAASLRGARTKAAPELATSAIERLGLGPWADRRSAELSLGNKQRLGLAAAIAHEPKILVLDEPVNALDPAGVLLVRELLRELVAEGCAILVSSHHLDEIARVADRITVIHRGSVAGTIDPSDADLERRFFRIAYEADVAAGLVSS